MAQQHFLMIQIMNLRHGFIETNYDILCSHVRYGEVDRVDTIPKMQFFDTTTGCDSILGICWVFADIFEERLAAASLHPDGSFQIVVDSFERRYLEVKSRVEMEEIALWVTQHISDVDRKWDTWPLPPKDARHPPVFYGFRILGSVALDGCMQ